MEWYVKDALAVFSGQVLGMLSWSLRTFPQRMSADIHQSPAGKSSGGCLEEMTVSRAQICHTIVPPCHTLLACALVLAVCEVMGGVHPDSSA